MEILCEGFRKRFSRSNLVPRGCDPFGQHQGSLDKGNAGNAGNADSGDEVAREAENVRHLRISHNTPCFPLPHPPLKYCIIYCLQFLLGRL